MEEVVSLFKKISISQEFYKNSLILCGANINKSKKSKSLKDLVGYEYEQHRKRIWEHYGFTVSKDNKYYKTDWCIYYNNKLVAIEEDKGHYVDKCFCERSLMSFCKVINKNQINPKFILHSFTRYRLFDKNVKEFGAIIKEDIFCNLKQNLYYSYLNDFDRIKKDWFSLQNNINPYEIHQNENLIERDIDFILSLKN